MFFFVNLCRSTVIETEIRVIDVLGNESSYCRFCSVAMFLFFLLELAVHLVPTGYLLGFRPFCAALLYNLAWVYFLVLFSEFVVIRRIHKAVNLQNDHTYDEYLVMLYREMKKKMSPLAYTVFGFAVTIRKVFDFIVALFTLAIASILCLFFCCKEYCLSLVCRRSSYHNVPGSDCSSDSVPGSDCSSDSVPGSDCSDETDEIVYRQ